MSYTEEVVYLQLRTYGYQALHSDLGAFQGVLKRPRQAVFGLKLYILIPHTKDYNLVVKWSSGRIC